MRKKIRYIPFQDLICLKKIIQFISASGKKVKETEEENKYGKMEIFMKVIGKTTKYTNMVVLQELMEIVIQANGLMKKLLVKEFIINPLEINMRENFMKMSNMDQVLNILRMVAPIMVNFTEVKDKEKGNLLGLMDHITKEIFSLIKFLGPVNINGWMAGHSQASGRMVIWKVME